MPSGSRRSRRLPYLSDCIARALGRPWPPLEHTAGEERAQEGVGGPRNPLGQLRSLPPPPEALPRRLLGQVCPTGASGGGNAQGGLAERRGIGERRTEGARKAVGDEEAHDSPSPDEQGDTAACRVVLFSRIRRWGPLSCFSRRFRWGERVVAEGASGLWQSSRRDSPLCRQWTTSWNASPPPPRRGVEADVAGRTRSAGE